MKTIFLNFSPLRAGVFLISIVLLTACDETKQTKSNEGYYTCSMHPQVIKHEPGNCPICHMKLNFVKTEHSKKEHKEYAENTEKKKQKDQYGFRFSVKQTILKNANIATVPAIKESFSREAQYSAHLDYSEDPNHLVVVSTKYDGWIEKLYVSKEGQYVNKGKALMEIYSPTILTAKEEYLILFKTLKSMFVSQNKPLKGLYQDPTLKAARQKLLYLDVPYNQIKKLEKEGKVSRRSFYISPISGVIVKKEALQGAYIKTGQEILRIANLSQLWAFIHIFEKDLLFIKKGQRVTLKTQNQPNTELKGYVDLIYPFIDPESKDIKVRIIINNHKRNLKPGMFAQVTLKQKLQGKQIVIPDSAVIYSGETSYVFLSLGDGEFELRPLNVRVTSHGKAVISSGLKENDFVVTNGQFLLDSEASLKEAISKGKK